MAAILGMVAIGAWAIFTGQISYTITHGISMNPVYFQGDLVFVVKSSEYQIGEIAEYRDSTTGIDVLHRIISGDSVAGFTFKGDNNQSTDKFHPRADQILGRALLHVPHGGIWLKPLLSPTGLGMVGFLIVGGGAASARTRREIPRGRRKKKVKATARQESSWGTAVMVAKAVEHLPPLLRSAAALAAALTGLGLTLAVLGWMKPATHTQHGSAAPPSQSMTYSYSATVSPSAAYDGTIVSSPEPIFRKLTDLVALHLRYKGHPGTVVVTAALSDGSGWHSTMVVAPRQTFAGQTYDTTVHLDLGVFDKRAQAAAKAIGSSPGPLTITLTARVTSNGEPAFSAPLSFSLAPPALTLTGGASSLVVDDASADTKVTVVPREIKLLGYSIMTASAARAYAVLMLLGALVCAVGIALVARRGAPARTRAEIERRHPQLLVPVEPMATPPSKPVVNVDNFPALTKLAERYGQMILTWSLPDADDFIVRDEGITYRYRTPHDGTSLGDDAPTEFGNVEEPVRSRPGVTVPATTEDQPTTHRDP